ncbi:thioesterase superfamily protein [Paraburkholderia xenovorans LB400]|jgi:acyl-CoA thioester hydrolase|uniref:Predicted thioesterase, FcbC-like protein n=1 Tax=Paraburkholderia xenovorans (strain LB400) TaxID=266265 RepID=Q140L6_PARXL|nr:thioesterase family protein [Paraburkholderia xenovorans]ABE30223.1 Predicted thioesterase, FcbC-like protein [Paraburkholderia xenovorans LB400]AIP31401.1 thioesterase superfamily protein [Paraburkholderia xenovorans LB400]
MTSMSSSDVNDAWFSAKPVQVDDAWIDHNGHMHLPFYTVLFIRAVGEVMERLGIGESYTAQGLGSFFGVENHVRYLHELKAGETAQVELCLLECDAKRLHWWARMSTHGQAIAATFELLSLHVDQRARRVVPMPDGVYTAVRDFPARHRELGPPPHAWRVGTLAVTGS